MYQSGVCYNAKASILDTLIHLEYSNLLTFLNVSRIFIWQTWQTCIVQSSQDAGELKDLTSLLQSDVYFYCKSFSKFIENECHINVNFKLWWQYIKMVSIGNWHLHIASFTMMIPYFFHYDHQNYACWGIVYIAEMSENLWLSFLKLNLTRLNQIMHKSG